MFAHRIAIGLLVYAGFSRAEVHNLTLRQALELASKQNPDVALSRLDQQYSQDAIDVAQDPFRPKLYLGSGLAYTYGYPNSIDGNAPSLAQLKTDMFLYNRQKSYALASAREQSRGSQMGAQAKAEEVAYQAAGLFITSSQLEHETKALTDQLPSLQKVVQVMAASVTEGNELPLELKRARVNLAMSQQRLESAQLDVDYYEMMLATALGFSAADRMKPVDSDLSTLSAPPPESEAAETVLRENRELKQMQSNVLAKELDIKSFKAARFPQVGLVAQYSYFAKYNYAQYFQKFQHNNAQLGASVTIPLLVGSASRGYAGQTYTELQKLRIQMDQTRNRLLTDTHRSYDLWKKAQNMQSLTRLQLDLAREELTVKLAQNGEGRVPVSALEQARLDEGNHWMAFYEANMQELRARLAILKQTGNLLAAVRELPVTPAVTTQP